MIPRDVQREKLYRAERSIRGADAGKVWTPGDFAAVKRYADGLLRQVWLRRNWPRAPRQIRVEWHKGGRKAVALWGAPVIAMPMTLDGEPARWAWTELVVLHEIAHHLVGPYGGGGPHGWEFAAALLRLVRNRMGVDAERRLRAAYKAERVRYTKPRQLSPEARAAAAERLAAHRPKGRAALDAANAARREKAAAERAALLESESWNDDRWQLRLTMEVLERLAEGTPSVVEHPCTRQTTVERDRGDLWVREHARYVMLRADPPCKVSTHRLQWQP